MGNFYVNQVRSVQVAHLFYLIRDGVRCQSPYERFNDG